MSKSNRSRRAGYVYFDPEKFERQLQRLGYSNTRLADVADISRGTVIRASKGLGTYRSTAQQIAQAMGLEDATLLLCDSDESKPSPIDPSAVGEWEIEKYLGQWNLASNGLRYRFCLMRHRFVAGRLGRGKWYDLLGLTTEERQEMETQLVRHPTVCDRIGRHEHIAENLNTCPGSDDESWWVIDRWHTGPSLATWLSKGSYPKQELPELMRQIGEGLKALHGAGIVFRELAPSRVLITEPNQSVILTDFELAKLMDSAPTVSRDWPDDPYRAPEVKSGAAEPRSDLYSWARILTHAACGVLPPPGDDVEAVSKHGLPKAVWKVTTDCLAPGPSARPASIDVVLDAINRWR